MSDAVPLTDNDQDAYWAAAVHDFLALDEAARHLVLEGMAPRNRAAMLSSIDWLTNSR
jgi:hypothetical protein